MGTNDFGLRRTYEMAPDPPTPMEVREYTARSTEEYLALINGPDRGNEAAIHSFLEQNPAFVPGAFSYPASGHGPIFWGVFTKPRLAGDPGYIPDFLWLATATDRIYPVFVEIENPTKRWFTANGQQTAEFTQAQAQIQDWKRWLRNPAQFQAWMHSLDLPDGWNRGYELHPQYVLIFGSSAEFEQNPELRGRRRELEGEDERVMTFDNLRPDANALWFMTLTRINRQVHAMTVPPTFEIGPNIGRSILEVHGVNEAIARQTRMTQERREFLQQRLPYWTAYLRRQEMSFRNLSDWE